MHYVYVLQNEKRGLYFGFTHDLRRRLKEHNSGRSSFTSGHTWKLVYYEAYQAESDARRREQRLKDYGQSIRQLKDRLADSLNLS